MNIKYNEWTSKENNRTRCYKKVCVDVKLSTSLQHTVGVATLYRDWPPLTQEHGQSGFCVWQQQYGDRGPHEAECLFAPNPRLFNCLSVCHCACPVTKQRQHNALMHRVDYTTGSGTINGITCNMSNKIHYITDEQMSSVYRGSRVSLWTVLGTCCIDSSFPFFTTPWWSSTRGLEWTPGWSLRACITAVNSVGLLSDTVLCCSCVSVLYITSWKGHILLTEICASLNYRTSHNCSLVVSYMLLVIVV